MAKIKNNIRKIPGEYILIPIAGILLVLSIILKRFVQPGQTMQQNYTEISKDTLRLVAMRYLPATPNMVLAEGLRKVAFVDAEFEDNNGEIREVFDKFGTKNHQFLKGAEIGDKYIATVDKKTGLLMLKRKVIVK